MGCLTEQFGRHFWRVKKTSSSSDAQPPYLAPLSLAWQQAHIVSSTWDRKPWGAAAGSGDINSFFVLLAVDLLASTTGATMSLLQFNLEVNVRRQGLGVGEGEG